VSQHPWAPTRALGRAVLVVGLLLVLAAGLGRLDLVLLAMPFALGTAWSLRRRPQQPPRATIALTPGPFVEGSEISAELRVDNPADTDLDLAVLRVRHSPWLRLVRGEHPFAATVRAGDRISTPLGGPALRWGRHRLGPVHSYAVACDGLLVSAPLASPSALVKVFPATAAFNAADAMPRAAGLVGAHRSRRPGEGGELAGIRQYSPGDRLRRLNWRVTLRTGRPHVAHTLSDRDAEVVLLLDVVYDAGKSGGIHGSASVLDTTVRAAAGIAEHYLLWGDRVSLLEYSFHTRRLRAASGRRQYQAVLEWLLNVSPTEGAPDQPPPLLFGPHLLPANALIIVLTPLLEAHSAAMVGELARSGRFIVAVDTLGPIGEQQRRASGLPAIAYRLWHLERDVYIGQLREVGVPVVAWSGAGSLDQVLRDVSRMAAAPRVRPR
jgi:uncharacterized protein (DUF58 family)